MAHDNSFREPMSLGARGSQILHDHHAVRVCPPPARARWTLLELGVPFESIAGRETFQNEALQRVHPLRRLPALLDDGRPLFESAAIIQKASV